MFRVKVIYFVLNNFRHFFKSKFVIFEQSFYRRLVYLNTLLPNELARNVFFKYLKIFLVFTFFYNK